MCWTHNAHFKTEVYTFLLRRHGVEDMEQREEAGPAQSHCLTQAADLSSARPRGLLHHWMVAAHCNFGCLSV